MKLLLLVLFCSVQIKFTKLRAIKVVESTLQLSNIDIVASYVFKREKSAPMPVVSTVQNDIIGPAVSEAEVSFILFFSGFMPFSVLCAPFLFSQKTSLSTT